MTPLEKYKAFTLEHEKLVLAGKDDEAEALLEDHDDSFWYEASQSEKDEVRAFSAALLAARPAPLRYRTAIGCLAHWEGRFEAMQLPGCKDRTPANVVLRWIFHWRARRDAAWEEMTSQERAAEKQGKGR